MGWDSASLPEHIRRLIPKEERKKVGVPTNEDISEEQSAKIEKELQRDILALLEEHRGIVVIYSGMHRKTSTPKGTPDFIFAVKVEADESYAAEQFACAWELKVEGGRRSKEQVEMERRMTTPPNAWRYRLVYNVQQAREELQNMGL